MLSRFAAGVAASVAAGGRVRLVEFVEVIELGPFFFGGVRRRLRGAT
jgi:hypothetical protein